MNTQYFRSLLKDRNFLYLWVSQMLSQFTIQIINYYILTRIYFLTQSSLAVSFVWIAGSLPALLFGPFSGAIVDRFSRRRILIFTNIGQGLVISSALFVKSSGIFPLYVISFAYWAMDQLYFPSQQASAPHLVKKELLATANGLFLITQQASIIIGFVLGGIMLSILGAPATITIAAMAQLLAAVACFRLPKDTPAKSNLEKTVFQFLQDLQEGFKYIISHQRITLCLLAIICTQIIVSVISTLMPAYAREILNINLNIAGLVLIVPGVLGAVLTIFTMSHLQERISQSKLVRIGLTIGGLGILTMGIGANFPSETVKLFISIIASAALGVSFVTVTVPAQTYIQQNSPVGLLGRIYGQLGFLLILSTTVPLLAAATVADLIGIAPMLVILGLVVLWGRYVVEHRLRI